MGFVYKPGEVLKGIKIQALRFGLVRGKDSFDNLKEAVFILINHIHIRIE